jgi:hypothetical protein
MSVPQRDTIVRQKKRRAADNNYSRLSKTLCKKLLKLCRDYDADIYFLAFRNGRYRGFVTTDENGQPWSPPDQKSLVRIPSCLFHYLSVVHI